ncbi:hypothetical protein E2562_028818 [Oryza meyeriana var. granulata]|uniref:F-box associated beta-propeller type 3 domain-containing protein n=1 Tax=Oryza meyeriana var. granulata TaxID=110450 RepID=A0A6G1FD76_9ORYZ|nr:hypothetical protein E2562_028818 [Oryza meyeriana var. granulata]
MIRAHLRHSASKWEQSHCFIISPDTLDREPGERCLYQLQRGTCPNKNVATPLHAKDFHRHFNTPLFMHCDGLVLSMTETRLYLFNPATRDAITLPDSFRNNLGGKDCCYCAGLGLDPRTGKYKTVQALYRSMDPVTKMGMEVFTIACDDGGTWRKMMNNPPYPAKRFQTALAVSGFDHVLPHRRGPCSLEEEEFGITGLPPGLDLDNAFRLDVLHGRDLCVTACITVIAQC